MIKKIMLQEVVSSRKSKYNAVKVRDKSLAVVFDSKMEYSCFLFLKSMKDQGSIQFFLLQPLFNLPGGIKYKADFQVFLNNGRSIFIDIKGMETKEFKIKKKLVEEFYPVSIYVFGQSFRKELIRIAKQV